MSQIKTKYIANNQVTNTKLAQMNTLTIKGNSTGGTADPQDLSASTVTNMLVVFTGDSGSGGSKGLVPAPSTGDATKYLKGDGTWASIPGAGPGDLAEASFAVSASLNNTTVVALSSSVRSYHFIWSLANTTSDLYEAGEFNIIRKNGSYNISSNSVGDNLGISFSVSNSGDLQVTSGATTATFKYRAMGTSV
jgi:hypothetical protein